MQEIALVENLGKTYSGKNVFSGLNMSIMQYEPIIVMGENGCGKSTFLKILAGIISPTEGQVKFNSKIKISYMPDRFPKLNFSIKEYLFYMGKLNGFSNAYINKYLKKFFQIFNIPQSYIDKQIFECSKGTLQKVNALQAFMAKSDLIILDEPFSGLDYKSIDNFIDLIKHLINDGASLVMACHQNELALRFTGDIYIFKDNKCVLENNLPYLIYVKFFCKEKDITMYDFLDKVMKINISGEICEILIEKRDLRKIIEILLSHEFEIHSIIPK
ncbi:MAG: ATP-binding cassette domain-containing protein [Clostridiales bacterium]|jgi:ABC-type multidrug transport system ATPase subunit|nr:ATP-binding cassette domain-containing protein [Clostridiales bacterium]